MQLRLGQLVISFIGVLSLVASSHIQSVRLTEEAIRHEHENYLISIHNSNVTLFTGPRDYYTVAIFTTSDEKQGCDICQNVDKIISKIDLAQGNHGIFNHLAVQTIPHVWLIPPNLKIEEGADIDDSNRFQLFDDPHFEFKIPTANFEEQVMQFARFLSEGLQKNILIRQDSPVTTFVKTFAVTLLVILIIKRRGPNGVRNIPKSKIILFILIFLLLIFVCGYQFTVQSGVPFVAKGKDNEIIIISGGRHYQFGIEVALVGLNYFGLATSLLVLVYLGQYNVTSESVINSDQIKFGLILLTNIVLYFLYSSLTSIVLRKDHGYPYAFTKLF